MKAIVQTAYGPPDEVLELREIDRPVAGNGEVLIRVHAASAHPDVSHAVRGVPYVLRIMGAGLRKPKTPVPGTDVAGRVEAVGPNVTRFRPGDEVFGEIVKGNQWRNGGAYAEYAAARGRVGAEAGQRDARASRRRAEFRTHRAPRSPR